MASPENPSETTVAQIGTIDTVELNKLELTSLSALMAYAAYRHNISEDDIMKNISQHFGVDELSQVPGYLFDEVIKFLVNFQIDVLLH